MITTREITLDKSELFRVLLRLNFPPKTGLLYLLAAILTIVWLVLFPYQKQIWILAGAIVIFPLLTLVLTRMTARNPMNGHFAAPRYYTVAEGRIIAHMADGEQDVYNVSHPHKIIRTKRYYLLFPEKGAFLYIPYDAFTSSGDRDRFEREVAARAHRRR